METLLQTIASFFIGGLALWFFIGLIDSYIKNKQHENRIKCPQCKNIMTIWNRSPIRIEEVGRGDIYDKEVPVEVGYSDSNTYGIDWGNRDRDSSDYSSHTSTTHYEYQKRPHQKVEYRHVFSCIKCEAIIGVRRWKEIRLN